MIDLETLSVQTDAVIVSVGAVKFDPERGVLGDTFYSAVDLTCYNQAPRVGQYAVDGKTLMWWVDQGEAARAVFNDPNAKHIFEVLMGLSHFVRDSTYVWSNGANFDIPILEHAYKCEMSTPPWKFFNVRCHRTLKNLVPRHVLELPDLVTGVEHNALDDAIYQAHEALRAITYLQDMNDARRDTRQSA